jgi:hypothetical protein
VPCKKSLQISDEVLAELIGRATGRPDIYLKVVASLMPKEANINQQVNVSDKFRKLLDSMEERAKIDGPRQQLLIDRLNAIDVEPEPIEA